MTDITVLRLRGLEEFEENIPKLLSKAKSSIEMSTSLYPPFYNKETIRKTIEGCIEKGIKFKILLDKRVNVPELVSKLPWIFSMRIKYPNFRIAKSEEDIHHLIIVDNKHFRLESSHKEKVGKKNLIIYDIPTKMVEPLKYIFEDYWENSEEVPQYKV